VALDLYETGMAMTRARLQREHPDASNDEIDSIDSLVAAWLADRPLDCPGPERPFSR
jgi:hypothetical protein